MSLPIVQIGETVDRTNLTKLHDACTKHGFFFLSNRIPDGGHHVAPDLIARMWEVSEKVLNVPFEEKMDVHVKRSSNHRGYFCSADYVELNKDPVGAHVLDQKEGFFFGSDSLIAPGNIAPVSTPSILPLVEEYMEACRIACIHVMHAITTTGLMGDIDLADPVYMLKLLKYPKNGGTDAHTDYGLITMLLTGDSGLQIYYGGHWQAVPVVPDSFVINVGDLLAMWTCDAIKSTIHRVQYVSNSKPRYSIPFFLHPRRGTHIHCRDGTKIDSYDYLLSRFDLTYHHRTLL